MSDFDIFLTQDLQEVKTILKKQALKIEDIETKPPGKKEGQGKKRVIAVKQDQKRIKLIWCYEDYS